MCGALFRPWSACLSSGLRINGEFAIAEVHHCDYMVGGWRMRMQIIGALVMMVRDGSLWRLHKDWKLSDSLKASALPAAIYAVQNTLLQLSYRHLDSLTFSLLNQTKLVFTAVFMFLLLGYGSYTKISDCEDNFEINYGHTDPGFGKCSNYVPILQQITGNLTFHCIYA